MATGKDSTYLYDPTKFKLNDPNLVTSNYQLSPEDMARYGILVTKLRRQFEDRYNQIESEARAQQQ